MERIKSSRVQKKEEIFELREEMKSEVASLLLGFSDIDDRKQELLIEAKDFVSHMSKEKSTV